MESKKNIGQFMKDSLSGLDAVPSDQVWGRIEEDLNGRKKKRRFFFWLFFSFLLSSGLIGIGSYYAGTHNTAINPAATPGNNPVVTSSESTSRPNQKNSNGNPYAAPNRVPKAGAIIIREHQTDNAAKSRSAFEKNNITTPKNRLAARKTQAKEKPYPSTTAAKHQKGWHQASSVKNTTYTNHPEQKAFSKITVDGPGQFNNLDTSTATATATKNQPTDSLSIQTAASEKKKTKKESPLQDSTVVTPPQKTREIILAPYYGLNYGGYFGGLGTLSNNKVLDESAALRDSYGLLVRWMFSPKIGIQTGIGKINSRYQSTIDKPDYTFLNTQNVSTDLAYSDLMGIFANETQVKLTYDSSILEVPLEAYYVLRDKKLGLAGSLGFSVLFGGKNTIYAESAMVPQMPIGKLITDTGGGFTANAKLYLFYRITPSLQWDLYPAFQYRVMGNIENNSGYFFSLRTGLSYKF